MKGKSYWKYTNFPLFHMIVGGRFVFKLEVLGRRSFLHIGLSPLPSNSGKSKLYRDPLNVKILVVTITGKGFSTQLLRTFFCNFWRKNWEVSDLIFGEEWEYLPFWKVILLTFVLNLIVDWWAFSNRPGSSKTWKVCFCWDGRET